MPPHLLLIGGTGFLGRHLARRAIEAGYGCTLVGRSAAALPGVDAPVFDVDGFAGPAGDRAIRDASAVIYLVSSIVPAALADTAARDLCAEVKPAFEVFLRIALANPSARIIFISSGGAVYGNAAIDPIPEDAPLEPISLYGLAKVLIEKTLMFSAQTNGLQVAILRVSNPVGRHHSSRRQGLVSAILRAVAVNRPLPVYGDGSHVRDYLDADDVADAILLAADLPAGAPQIGVWNVGSGHGHSVCDIVELVGSVIGTKPHIEWLPARPTDVKRIVLDVSRAHRELGWSPSTPLRRSIEKIVETANPLHNEPSGAS